MTGLIYKSQRFWSWGGFLFFYGAFGHVPLIFRLCPITTLGCLFQSAVLLFPFARTSTFLPSNTASLQRLNNLSDNHSWISSFMTSLLHAAQTVLFGTFCPTVRLMGIFHFCYHHYWSIKLQCRGRLCVISSLLAPCFIFFPLLISKHLNLQVCRSHNSLSLLALPFFLWVSFYSDLPRQCSISVLYFLYFFLTLYFVHVSSDVPVTLGLFEFGVFLVFFTFLSIFVPVLCLTFFCLTFLCCFPPPLFVALVLLFISSF